MRWGADRPGTPKQKQCEVAWQDGSLGLIINETCLVLSVTKGGPADKVPYSFSPPQSRYETFHDTSWWAIIRPFRVG